MSLKSFFMRELTLKLRLSNVFARKTYATSSDITKSEQIDITSVDSDPKYDEEVLIDYAELERKRNKSRLTNAHRNIIRGNRPYEKPGISYHHATLQWQRKMLGRYGIEGSNVPPGVAWPTKKAIHELKEYEKVAYPDTIQESWKKLEEIKQAKEERYQFRITDIAEKMKKTEKWEKELRAKLAKKEGDIKAAKERKERLIEEVRRHFGFKVDPRDERFKDMIEQKEREEKKRRKDAKKKERAERVLAHVLQTGQTENNDKKINAKTETPTDLA